MLNVSRPREARRQGDNDEWVHLTTDTTRERTKENALSILIKPFRRVSVYA